jgi:hypothetical protein
VGKIGVEDGVLKKPGKLTTEEYDQIRAHVRIGVHILADLKKLPPPAAGVAYHHESMDGSGYPAGLRGEAIPLVARILAVADAYDAMSSSRPYRRRMSPSQIEEVFREGAGTQWDPKVLEALAACCDDLARIRQKGLGESLQPGHQRDAGPGLAARRALGPRQGPGGRPQRVGQDDPGILVEPLLDVRVALPGPGRGARSRTVRMTAGGTRVRPRGCTCHSGAGPRNRPTNAWSRAVARGVWKNVPS